MNPVLEFRCDMDDCHWKMHRINGSQPSRPAPLLLAVATLAITSIHSYVVLFAKSFEVKCTEGHSCSFEGPYIY